MSSQTEIFSTAVIPEATLLEIFDSSERAATIVGCAMIEDELRSRIEAQLSPPENPKADPLFDGESPLQSFSAKTILAQRMGIINGQLEKQLHRLRKIRNKYAHQSAIIDTGVKDIRDSLIDEFFLRELSVAGGAEIINNACYTVSGSYVCPGTPLNEMIQRKSTPREVSFRIMLIAMLGILSNPAMPGGVRVGGTCFYTRTEKGQLVIHSVCLCCDRVC